jgi:Ni,Fe-hydrogenase maturation factor
MREPAAAAGVPPLLRDSAPRVWHLAPLGVAGAQARRRILIGGLGYWWQRDASFGLHAAEALAAGEWPPGIRVEKLDYGAIYVAQDLLAVQPPYERFVLLAGVGRGRAPGSLHRRLWSATERDRDPDEVHRRMLGAGSGIVDLDHLLVIADHLGALPREVVLIEYEPVDARGGEALSPHGEGRLQEAVELARRSALEDLPSPAAP